MKKQITIILSVILFLCLAGYFTLNFTVYDAPTPCYGKKTSWTQSEIEDHAMQQFYESAKSLDYPTYEDFINHPGTVSTFSERKSRSRNEILKGRYDVSVAYKILEGEDTGIIKQHNRSFSKCLRNSGYYGERFDPLEDTYKAKFYRELVREKANSK